MQAGYHPAEPALLGTDGRGEATIRKPFSTNKLRSFLRRLVRLSPHATSYAIVQRTCDNLVVAVAIQPHIRQCLPPSDNRQKATGDAVVLAAQRQILPPMPFVRATFPAGF
jgi:hypothetical protein